MPKPFFQRKTLYYAGAPVKIRYIYHREAPESASGPAEPPFVEILSTKPVVTEAVEDLLARRLFALIRQEAEA